MKTKKQEFQKPEIALICFGSVDVITASSGGGPAGPMSANGQNDGEGYGEVAMLGKPQQ